MRLLFTEKMFGNNFPEHFDVLPLNVRTFFAHQTIVLLKFYIVCFVDFQVRRYFVYSCDDFEVYQDHSI